jgi:lipoyl(octanoyl) transferase
LNKQQVFFEDLGIINYKSAWDYQEVLVKENLAIKTEARKRLMPIGPSTFKPEPSTFNLEPSTFNLQPSAFNSEPSTRHYLLFCEHPPVYTLGKSGHMENVLLSEDEMEEKEIEFFRTNRGGDITFHGLQQVVGYPILDLEKFYTDIGKYLRSLEQVIILTIAEYDIKGDRSKGETGVWIDPGIPGRERKICAMGIRCSRWITMHGFALNVNTDLSYFNNIIPCGIVNKQVTSIEKEVGQKVDYEELKNKLLVNFGKVFEVDII